jgi:hypothetical protein
MTLLPLINHALELEKSQQISILLATCVSQCNISLVLGVSLMRSTFNTAKRTLFVGQILKAI